MREVTVPHLVLQISLIQRAFQLLGKSLGVISSFVLGHAEQHSSCICSCNEKIVVWQLKLTKINLESYLRLHF